jgi:hypothetical protein
MQLVCFYCNQVPHCPTQLLSPKGHCNHIFCDSCVAAHLPKTCPKCGEPVTRIVPDHKTACLMSLMRVKCPRFTQGCSASGTLRMEIIPPTKPNGFETYNVGIWLQEHEAMCKFARQRCRFCKQVLTLNQIEGHLKSDCKFVNVDCGFAHLGCRFKGRRFELNRHLKDSWGAHFQLTANALQVSFFVVLEVDVDLFIL